MQFLNDLWRQYRMHRRMNSDSDYWFRVNRWHELGVYNSERSRGVVHTPQYVARMRNEQAAFQAETEEQRKARLDPSS